MPKLEVLLKDGGIEEFETVPVADDSNQNPAIPKPSNQGTTIIKTAVVLGLGKQVISSGIGLIGESTGDYALERKVKGIVSGAGIATGLVAYTIPTMIGIGIKESTDAYVRSRAITRKQIEADLNKQRIGKVVSSNSRVGGAK